MASIQMTNYVGDLFNGAGPLLPTPNHKSLLSALACIIMLLIKFPNIRYGRGLHPPQKF